MVYPNWFLRAKCSGFRYAGLFCPPICVLLSSLLLIYIMTYSTRWWLHMLYLQERMDKDFLDFSPFVQYFYTVHSLMWASRFSQKLVTLVQFYVATRSPESVLAVYVSVNDRHAETLHSFMLPFDPFILWQCFGHALLRIRHKFRHKKHLV